MFNERGRPNKKTNVSILSNSIKTVVYELIQSHPSICSTHFWQNWWLHCQIGEIGGRSFHWNGWCWLLIWYAAHLKCRKIANDHYRRGKMRCMDGDGLFRLVWSACWCVCTFELIYDMLSNSHLKWVGVNDTHNTKRRQTAMRKPSQKTNRLNLRSWFYICGCTHTLFPIHSERGSVSTLSFIICASSITLFEYIVL